MAAALLNCTKWPHFALGGKLSPCRDVDRADDGQVYQTEDCRIGKGPEIGACEIEKTPDGRQLNRRVEIKLVPLQAG